MKKIVAVCLCALIISGLCVVSYAEGEQENDALILPLPQVETLRVASTTPMSGNFFTDMWGNNTSDMDVRALIHGYATVAWVGVGDCVIDETVVEESAVTDSAGGRTYEFTIRQGLTYNDGTPITAKDYVFGVLMLTDPRVTLLGMVPTTYEHLVGFDQYLLDVMGAMTSGGGQPIEVPFSGIRLLDEYRFSLTIAEKYLPHFYELTLASAQPYPIEVIAPECEIKDDGKGAYIAGPFDSGLIEETVLNPETGYLYNPRVTCGPYTLVSYDAEENIATFEKNEAFRGNAEGKTPSFPKVEYSFANPSTMLEDLKAGKVDILHKIGNGTRIEQAMESAAKGEIRMQNYLRSGFGYISFACEQGIAASANVRKAIAMCIDTEALCLEALKGFGIPVYGYYGLGQWMVADNQEALLMLAQNMFNINAAREALEKDGWTLNETGDFYDAEVGGTRYRKAEDGTLEELVLTWAIPDNSEIAQVLAQMLGENAPQAGIRIEETLLPFEEQLAHYYRQTERKYDMFFGASNFLLAFDPYTTFHTNEAYQGIFNTTGIQDEKLMELALAMRQTEPGDQEAYQQKWLEFQEYWIDVFPAVPLYSNIYFDFHRSDLQGYAPNSNWSWPNAILYAYIGEQAAEEEGEGDELSMSEGGAGEESFDSFEDSPDEGEEEIIVIG